MCLYNPSSHLHALGSHHWAVEMKSKARSDLGSQICITLLTSTFPDLNLAFLKPSIKAMSQVAWNMSANPTIAWNSNYTKIMIQNQTILISKYIEQLKQSLLHISVLHFGWKDSIWNQVPPWIIWLFWWCLWNQQHQYPCLWTVYHLFRIKCSTQLEQPPRHILPRKASIIWDVQCINQWLLELNKACAEALALIHLLAIPDWGGEVTMWQYIC